MNISTNSGVNIGLDIGEVVQRSGLAASTLRFYEEKNLITPVGRKGLRRVYDMEVLEHLALIAIGRNAGFTLDEIAAMFTPNGPRIDRAQLLAKADQLERTVKELTAMRDGLRHAARCPAPSHFECATFQRLLKVALKTRRTSQARGRSGHGARGELGHCK